MNEAAEEAVPTAAGGIQAAAQIPYPHIIAIGLFAAIFGISLGYVLARRKWIQPI
jgi:tetrahydromethanopterin S-methyltransferase subunit C